MSAVCNNLTTALLMGAVIMAMGKGNRQFVTVAAVNVVVAAMPRFPSGKVRRHHDIIGPGKWGGAVQDFFSLFLPAVVNFALPASSCISGFPGASRRGG